MSTFKTCQCGQEARLFTDYADNGQEVTFCTTCGNLPTIKTQEAVDAVVGSIGHFTWKGDRMATKQFHIHSDDLGYPYVFSITPDEQVRGHFTASRRGREGVRECGKWIRRYRNGSCPSLGVDRSELEFAQAVAQALGWPP